MIPPTCLLAQSLYFALCGHYTIRFSFVKTSSPWQNDPNCPVITGIVIHYSLLNRLVEVHKMQTKLPDQMMDIIIKELDERNMGEGLFNVSRIIQSIEKSNSDLKLSLMQHLGNSTANRSADSSQRIINQTALNPGRTLRSEAQESDSNDVKLKSEIDSIWAYYWGGHLYPIPHPFFFQIINLSLDYALVGIFLK